MKRVFTGAALVLTLVAAAAAPLTAERDRQRLLDLQHIQTLRPGVSGTPGAPNAANYNETKAGPSSPLPDPLKLADGTTVKTSDAWWQQRRQEIADAYESEVYGHMSDSAPLPVWSVAGSAPETVGGVKAVARHLVGHAAKAGLSLDIHLTVTLPAGAKRSVPVVLLLAPDPAKFKFASKWRELVLKRGWGAAELDVTSVQGDNGAELTGGVIGFVSGGKPREAGGWGVLRAWAWGASRVMDHFESDPAIDSGHVAIAGHSRFGKAALVAMAYDPRYAVAFISSSGAGGAAPFRRNYGERIENLAAPNEYHWFAGAFLKYSGPKTADDLPVDSDELIALCAPRPVFIGAGANGDNWVDAHGMFLAEVAAGPVYRLLGKHDLGTATMPKVGVGLVTGELAFRQHAEGHTPEPNWPYFLDFAARYLTPKKK